MVNRLEKGFTLIEAMIAMLIISIGLLAMASSLIMVIKTNKGSEQRMNMSTLAQSSLSSIGQKALVGSAYTEAQAKIDVEEQLLGHDVTATVTFNPTTLVQGAAGIVLKLEWLSSGETRSVTVYSRVLVP